MDPELLKLFAGTGAAGLILLDVLWWRKLLVPKWAYDEKVREVAELKAEVAGLRGTVDDSYRGWFEKVLPVLAVTSESHRELVELRREEAYERNRRRD